MKCPLCYHNNKNVSLIILSDLKKKAELQECMNCGLQYLIDIKKSRKHVYNENYSVWGKDEAENEKAIEDSKKTQFKYLLKRLEKYARLRNKTILDIGTGRGYMLDVAKKMGMKVYGLELSKYASGIAAKKFPGKIFNSEIGSLKTNMKFDIITMTDLVEHLPNIGKDFNKISGLLKPKGHLIITTPNTDSITKTIFGKNWFQYKFEHVVYFNKKSIQYMLKGYDIKESGYNTKLLKIAYYKLYMKKYSSPQLLQILPKSMDDKVITNPMVGELLVIAQKH